MLQALLAAHGALLRSGPECPKSPLPCTCCPHHSLGVTCKSTCLSPLWRQTDVWGRNGGEISAPQLQLGAVSCCFMSKALLQFWKLHSHGCSYTEGGLQLPAHAWGESILIHWGGGGGVVFFLVFFLFFSVTGEV